jgi:hypothetical protein
MPLGYTVHDLKFVQGALVQPAPLPIRQAGTLALDTTSTEIKGPCLLRLISDEAIVLDAREASADLNTATAQYRIYPNVPAEIPVHSKAIYLRTTLGVFSDAVDIGQPCDVIEVVPVLDTSAYAVGDVLFNPIAIPLATRLLGGRAVLQSVSIVDEDDQKPAMDLIFFSVLRSLGTINTAPSISDVDARDCLPTVSIAADRFIDLGGVSIGTALQSEMGRMYEAGTGSASIFVGAIARSAATFTAADKLRFRFGFVKA